MGIAVQTYIWANDSKSRDKATVMIYNSSFGSLDLELDTKAQISECSMDANSNTKPTLITANSSDVSIQNCHFENFVNEDRSTILFGHNNSNVTIENSVFIQHNSSEGVLFLQDNSSMRISSSLVLQNVASTVGYSAITLKDGIHAVLHDTVFGNNSAFIGGVVNAENKCLVTISNCTFSSNKAITGKTLNVPTKLKLKAEMTKNRTIAFRSPRPFNQTWSQYQTRESLAEKILNTSKRSTRRHLNRNNIRTFAPISPMSFNRTYLPVHPKKTEVLPAKRTNNYRNSTGPFDQKNIEKFKSIVHMLFNQMSPPAKEPETDTAHQDNRLINSSILRNDVRQEGPSQGVGGAVFVAIHSQLLVTNCTFTDNSAQLAAGAITAALNVTLDIQGTTFVNNKALLGNGGAINVQNNATLTARETTFTGNIASGAGGAITVNMASYLTMTNCVFDNNTSELYGGAIIGYFNATLDIQETNFTGNSALQSGAIQIQQGYLHATDCTFIDDHAEQVGGAIVGAYAVLEIQRTNFTANSAKQAGAIDIENDVHLRVTDCTFVDNHAEVYGGAIVGAFDSVLQIQESNFTGNRASEGGAIDVQHQGYLRVTDCTFIDNHAEPFGGAIVGSYDAVFDIQDTNFTGNSALQSGAIHIQQGYLHATDCTFIDNHAEHGGAILINQQGYLRAADCTFEDNHAEGKGGAIFGGYDAVLDIQRTNFTGNSAVQGGANCTETDVHLSVTDCTFLHNQAERLGGAIVGVFDAVLDIQGTSFTGNSASQGGAINVQQQATLSLTNCKLDRNFASDQSGAILVMVNVTLEIRETNFTNNSASHFGGALLVSQAQCHVVRSVFHSNIAGTVGGAVCIETKASLRIENTDFTNNSGSQGGAINIQSTSKLHANLCIFWENFAVQSGGAIQLDEYSTVVIESCHFLANHARTGSGGALLLSNSEHVSISDTFFLRNEASSSGGAIYLDGGTVTIDNFTCVSNRATGWGGCLYIDTATLTLNSSEISKNIGQVGGAGVAVQDSRIQVMLCTLTKRCTVELFTPLAKVEYVSWRISCPL